MITCEKCGTTSPVKTRFCGHCGNRMAEVDAAVKTRVYPWKALSMAMAGVLLLAAVVAACLTLLPQRRLKLVVGHEWVYSTSAPGDKLSPANEKEVTVTVTGKTAGQADTYDLTVSSREKPSTESFIVKSTKEGVLLDKSSAKQLDQSAMLVKYPLKNGMEWLFSPQKRLVAGMKVAGEETVTVPAGKFKCYKIDTNLAEGDQHITIWFNESVGFVKLLSWRENKGERASEFIAELKKHGKSNPDALKSAKVAADGKSERAACILNIRNVQQAIRSDQNLNNRSAGDAIKWSGIIGPGLYLEKSPTCPAHGKYIFKDKYPEVGTLAMECSLSGPPQNHEPENHSDW